MPAIIESTPANGFTRLDEEPVGPAPQAAFVLMDEAARAAIPILKEALSNS